MNVRALLERHYAKLVRLLYHRLGDLDQAEELAQVAFVRLLERRPVSPDGWLYVVAANLARDAIRGERRRSRHLALLQSERHDAETASAEPSLLAAESAAQVRAALSRLSERDRTLLQLWADGVRYRDMAAAIGVAPSSIAPLIARAQRRLCVLLPSERLRSSDGHRASAAER